MDMFTTLIESKNQYKDDIQNAIENSSKKFVECPCCEGKVKVYTRSIDKKTAKTLIYMYRSAGLKPVHVTRVQVKHKINAGGYFAQLKFWNLIEKSTTNDPKGGKESGFWKVTQFGELFIQGIVTVQKYIHVINNECIGLSGEETYIRDCLPENFDYDEMMKREGWDGNN